MIQFQFDSILFSGSNIVVNAAAIIFGTCDGFTWIDFHCSGEVSSFWLRWRHNVLSVARMNSRYIQCHVYLASYVDRYWKMMRFPNLEMLWQCPFTLKKNKTRMQSFWNTDRFNTDSQGKNVNLSWSISIHGYAPKTQLLVKFKKKGRTTSQPSILRSRPQTSTQSKKNSHNV